MNRIHRATLVIVAGVLGLIANSALAQVPVPIATGTPSFITSLTSDATYIYFGANDGTLYRVAKTGAGLQPIANSGGQIHGISVSAGYIYFDGLGSGIYRIPQDLSTGTSVVASDIGVAGALIGIIGPNLYYSNGSAIRRVPAAGGTATDVLNEGRTVRQYAVDESAVFFTYDSSTVYRLDMTTGIKTVAIPNSGAYETPLFLDATHVYYGAPSIFQAPKLTRDATLADVTTLVSDGNFAVGFVSDGNFVYYTEGPDQATDTNTLKAIPVTGGVATTLPSGVPISHMIYDSGSLYWDTPAEGSGHDAIYRLDVNAPPVTCPNGQTTIVFGNGIDTTRKQATNSVTKVLAPAVLDALGPDVDPSCITFAVAYDEKFSDSNNVLVSTANMFDQIVDAAVQQGIDFAANFWDYWYGNPNVQPLTWLTHIQRTFITSATSIFQPDLLAHEAFYNSELALGHNIIVVAHSQGNLYVNQAYDVVTSLGGSDRFHIVAVATPAHSVAGGGPYFTLVLDVITLVPGSLPANIVNDPPSPCLLGIVYSVDCHNFDNSYMAGDKTRPAIVDATQSFVP